MSALHVKYLLVGGGVASSAAAEDVFGAMPSYNMMTPMQRNNE